MTPRQKMEKCAGARWRSALGRSEVLWPLATLTGGRAHHLGQAAKMSEERFVKHYADISSEVHGIDAQIRERSATLSELKSAGGSGSSHYAKGNISGLEKEINKLTSKRKSLVGRLENSYAFMHKHHLNAASHAKTPGAMPDLSHHRTALEELKAGPRGGVSHFLKKWKVPLVGGALAVGGVMAIRHLRKKQQPSPEMTALPQGQVS